MGLPSEYLMDKMLRFSVYSWGVINDFVENVGVEGGIVSQNRVYVAFVHYLWPILVLAMASVVAAVVLMVLAIAVSIADIVDYIGGLRDKK